MHSLLPMNKITLYSNLYYNSGYMHPGGVDYRWDGLSSDNGTVGNVRSSLECESVMPIQGHEADFSAYLFNSVGIECSYTHRMDHRDLVRIIDVGSCPDWLEFARAGMSEFQGKPFILFSSQEPCTQLKEIFDFAPCIFVMDIAYGESTYERHLPFPAFFPRMMNPYMNTVTAYHTINFTDTALKPFIYNNLKYRLDGNKALTQYFLYKHNLLDRGIVTYNRGKGDILSSNVLDNYDEHEAVTAFETQILQADKHSNIDFDMYTRSDFINWLGRQNNMTLAVDSSFSRKKRYHPIYVYNETYFSMINEIGPVVPGTSIFSEKSLYPIMNGHPFIINTHHQKQIYKNLEELGFELYPHILDYSNTNPGIYASIMNSIQNIEHFNKQSYKHTIPETIKISYHNKQNFTNTRSKLWSTLRKTMISHLEKYFDACNK